ncbi:MAG: hypothetical protein NTV22_11795 [bacterium]|nr:hypothetical protein [bacterium]
MALVTERRSLCVPTADGEQKTAMQARALLWTSDKGDRMLDRIYVGIEDSRHNEGACEGELGSGKACVCEEIINRFHTWALKNKIINRGSLTGQFDVTMRVSEYVPYLDTLCCGTYIDEDMLLISNKVGEYTLRSLSGERPGNQAQRCCGCGRALDDNDIHWAHDDEYCCECFHDRFFYCHNCDQVYDVDHSITVNDHDYCEECVKELFACCGACHEYHVKGSMAPAHVADGTLTVCEDCLEGYVCCTGCLEYFDESLVQHDKDGNGYCTPCFTELHAESAKIT